MASSFLGVNLVTPKGVVAHTETDSVQAPGELGEFELLPGHVPMLTALKPGVLTIGSKAKARYAVGAGYLRSDPAGSVEILVEQAVPAGEVDVEAAKRDLSAADAELGKWGDKPQDGDYTNLVAQRSTASCSSSRRRRFRRSRCPRGSRRPPSSSACGRRRLVDAIERDAAAQRAVRQIGMRPGHVPRAERTVEQREHGVFLHRRTVARHRTFMNVLIVGAGGLMGALVREQDMGRGHTAIALRRGEPVARAEGIVHAAGASGAMTLGKGWRGYRAVDVPLGLAVAAHARARRARMIYVGVHHPPALRDCAFVAAHARVAAALREV